MAHRTGTDRSQLLLIPTCLDDLIGEENPVRLVDVFVSALDLESHGFSHARPKERGAPPYHPAPLLKLYLYGYLNRTRSSRQLEKACRANLEVRWLLQELAPSHATIADFRKTHPKPLREAFRTFNRFLREEGLFGGETVAVDGSKFRAQNSKKNNHTADKIERHIEYIDNKLERYFEGMDTADAEEAQALPAETEDKIAGAVKKLMERRFRYTDLQGQLEESGATQISTTDPDARALPLHMGIVEVGYNVHTATDDKHSLVAHFEATNENDTYALSPMATAAKAELGLKESDNLDVLADKGYCTASELKKCADAGTTTYVAPKDNVNAQKDRDFQKDKFRYDKATDTYACPQGETLATNGELYEKQGRKKGHKPYRFRRYTLSYTVCSQCPFADRCLGRSKSKYRHGKHLERSEFEGWADANRTRVEANREKYRRRQAIAEHPFGTVKRQWGYTYTLLKGMEKVAGGVALVFTAYNLRRCMSILGVKTLVGKLEGLKNGLKSGFWAIFGRWRPVVRHSNVFSGTGYRFQAAAVAA